MREVARAHNHIAEEAPSEMHSLSFKPARSPDQLGIQGGAGLYSGLISVLTLFVVSGAIAYLNTRTLFRNAELVTHTHEVLLAAEQTLSLIKDAETGQRGYLITGEDRYLETYNTAAPRIEEKVSAIERLTRDNPRQQERIILLRSRINEKMSELRQTIDVRKAQGFDAARSIVLEDIGQIAMEAIRSQMSEIHEEEVQLRRSRLREMEGAFYTAVRSVVITGLVGLLLSGAVAFLIRRSMLVRQRQEWLQTGELGLAKQIAGDLRLEQIGENALTFLAQYVEAQVGAFYVRQSEVFRRAATYGVPLDGSTPEQFGLGDALIGQAAKDGQPRLLRDIPEGYLTVGSALGRAQPRHLAVVPVTVDGVVNGVFELGFFAPISRRLLDLFSNVAEVLGTSIRSANYRANLQNFLEETQRQAEELQAQGEELRVSNEELEEQSRALRESQARLEQQQAELEQTNAQLEEQAQLLESQRDDVLRAKAELQQQSQELEQASKYKSDFLANMSHELRTPLNSSLILAKLLADNGPGNLSAEQVEYAKTIQAAGNDLLTLINDILDLSKIEAGHMEMRPERVSVKQILEHMSKTFAPVASQRNIGFRIELLPHAPQYIETDRQRLEQILKNLLSNAIKFTETGEVVLLVEPVNGTSVAFAVRDTGIGIPSQQQQMIFEAFRQADGTTNRKYGGTGLGLSIARELARLLGGEIRLVSEVGKGSVFTVIVPQVYDLAEVKPAAVPGQLVERERESLPPGNVSGRSDGLVAPARIDDDRESLSGSSRIILVIEDDPAFARIIYELAHELNFGCLIALTAEEGLASAVQYQPSAVILDIGLPDNSGLSVLDRLKRDSRTRHIPVHVVSGQDYTETALSLGAIGYMLKPVKREDLVRALQKLETRMEQRLRRVLIVEDDPVQLASLRKLLGLHDVVTVGAATAAQCLELLRSETFDCMVLDLSLPDASGYSLLETLSQEDAYAFPPVIVYTGRELSNEEEARLRRYSKSIIIKGAKSPDRLLDEVTLFLHQMVSDLPIEQQRMIENARSRDAVLEGKRILVVEDDVRNVFALTSILEPRGAKIQIARNGVEALRILEASMTDPSKRIDLVLMDVMMPEMDGITATREIRKLDAWKKLPIIALTAKAMRNDQEQCLAAGANDYMAKPLDVEKLLSLVRVWMPR